MEFEYDGKVLKFEKELSDLDNLVVDFVGILDRAGVKYVVVSGYVAILMGRSRSTEDIDIFIDRIDFDAFRRFFEMADKGGYCPIDSESLDDAFDRLLSALSVRFAEKDKAVPNFEVKFAKKDTDFISLNKPLEVVVNGHHLNMSPLEVQLPFKIWLGSDKDIEDAVHIHEIFKGKLDNALMMKVAKELKVEDEMVKHGIV